jgi:hypothetical protein
MIMKVMLTEKRMAEEEQGDVEEEYTPKGGCHAAPLDRLRWGMFAAAIVEIAADHANIRVQTVVRNIIIIIIICCPFLSSSLAYTNTYLSVNKQE